jgi:enoyl-CoA hydratase/carnithine racemase
MATPRHLLVEDVGPVTTITLNRPEKRNAMSRALMDELTAALLEAAGRVVVLAGAGPAFSAGHDLVEIADGSTDEHVAVFESCNRLMATVGSIDQPVIARVHGIATAAGCQLVAACDLAVAERGTRFATPGVNIGLFCSTPAVAVVRAVGRKRALQLLFTGEPIDADTACAWGLVNEVVAPDELDAAVRRLAERIAEADPRVIALGKRTFGAQADADLGRAYDVASTAMVENASYPEAREGIAKFLKR